MEKVEKFIDDIRLAGRIFIALAAFSLATAMTYTIVEDVRETKAYPEKIAKIEKRIEIEKKQRENEALMYEMLSDISK
jgi:hypothetical protein